MKLNALLMINLLAAGFCQGQDMALGARCGGLAGISVMMEDLWAWANNPAALARLAHPTTGMSFEQRFLLKETGIYAAGIVIPVRGGCLGAGTVCSGYSAFYTQDARIGFGKSFNDKLLAGVGIVYRLQKTGDGSPAIHMATFSLGSVIVLSEKISLGFAAFNPFKFYYRNKPYGSFPSVIKIGIAYKHSPALEFLAEAGKDYDLPLQIRLGCEISFRDLAFIRGGIRLMPLEYAVGAGFRKNKLSMEISSHYHEYLGFTPQLSFQYSFK